jgi:hypothetical protein
MATTDKDQAGDLVNMRKRIGHGAWLDGESLDEKGSATMPKANSDHGNFESSAIKKDNA